MCCSQYIDVYGAKLHSREYVCSLLNTCEAWCDVLPLTAEMQPEIKFWRSETTRFNGQNIWPTPSALRVVYTDASNGGYAGYTVEHGCHIAHGQWLPEKASYNSTWRELRAVRSVLETLVTKLRNQRVRWLTDNQNVCRIILTGSKNCNCKWKPWPHFQLQ